MTIRVAVNLLWLAPGRVGGSEEYLVRQLAGLPAHVALELVCTPAVVEAHPGLVAGHRTRVLRTGRDWRPLRIAAEHTWLTAVTGSVDVVHHGGGTAPLTGRRPYVLTVHDLQYRDRPENFAPVRRTYLRTVVPGSIRRAAIVTCPSDFVRTTVVDVGGIEPERVVVVPHGIPVLDRPRPEVIAEARAHVGVGDRPFVVYPAISHPHKRHDVLVDMLPHLDHDVRLVLLGGLGDGEAELQRHLAGSVERDRVVRPGRVPESVRDALIADAVAMVFPSEYEGFGAPLVEAMALDTPVVARASAAIPEVVGEAAVLVDGDDPAEWATAVETARGRRDELVRRGRERRSHFTVAASGAALATAYERAAT